MRGSKSKLVKRPAARVGAGKVATARHAATAGNAARLSSLRHADELMELAVDAAQSRHLPEFLYRFAQRSARMLNASWGAVLVVRGRETEFYETPLQKQLLTQQGRPWVIAAASEPRISV